MPTDDRTAEDVPGEAGQKLEVRSRVRHLEELSRLVSAPTRLSGASDLWLADELNRLHAQWDAERGHPDEEGHGGSPGEWLWEQIGEVDQEIKRRANLSPKPQERQPKREER